ncbi:MAG: hypothetical protein ABEJ31_05735 [Haloarculaceae archaeon]
MSPRERRRREWFGPGEALDRRTLLAVCCFAALFGQPAVVVALAAGSADPATLSVVVVGTALLSIPAARAFVRRGRSVGRLADVLITAALVQMLLVLVVDFLEGMPALADAAWTRPAIALASFPMAYAVVYRARVSPLGD